jgi:orotate phosphoribosyltransferase-like protein
MKKNKYETGITTTPAQILAAKVIQLAILGIRKEAIATELNTSIHNVTRIIYSDRGQITLKQALANIELETANKLPALMESALSELEKIMLTSQASKTRLDAIKTVIGLTLNLSSMAGGISDASVIDSDNSGANCLTNEIHAPCGATTGNFAQH